MMTETETRLDLGIRLRLHLIPLGATLFLAAYSRFVCPFIHSLTYVDVTQGLLVVAASYLLIREVLYVLQATHSAGRHPARHHYLHSVLGWLTAGAIAVAVHEFRYPDFPWVSHVKLLAGYWALGGGILAMIEYAALERYYRSRVLVQPAVLMERMTRRLMEGFAIAALVPVVTLALTTIRFVEEGYASPVIVGEVLFLGMVFMAAALFAAWRYGASLRDDCDGLLRAVREIEQGRYDFAIDSSRADELGRVAEGINGMARGLALRERIRDAFGRFVDPSIAEAVIKDLSKPGQSVRLGGRRVEVTVLVGDLRGRFHAAFGDHVAGKSRRLTERAHR